MNKSTSFSFVGEEKMLPREAYLELLKSKFRKQPK
jgi:hypothetical protein